LARRNSIYLLSLHEDPENCDPQIINHLKLFCQKIELVKAPPKKLGFSMISRLIISLISFEPYTVWRHYSPRLLKRSTALGSSQGFDLVHCDILPVAYALENITSIPCTLTDHDVCFVKSYRLAKQTKNVFLKLFLLMESFKQKKYESKIFDNITLGITVSETDKMILKELCPKGNFIVCENGVNLEDFKPGAEEVESSTIFWIGGFGYSPNNAGVEFFLNNIYPLIKKEAKDVKLVLVGDDVPKWLRQLSKRDSSVKIMGYVEDPLPLMQKATAFIVPILSGGGTRLKIIEAMAAGKAIVTTTVGAEGIEGQNYIHYITADEPKQFAKSVLKILGDKEFRENLESNGRKLAVEKYDWQIIVDKIDHAYQQITNNSSQ
jgi:glycosyltransferase involved in cell wall biosynthesis